MPEEQKEKDCTDCMYFGCCYLRRHRENKEDLTPCKDIVVMPQDREEM